MNEANTAPNTTPPARTTLANLRPVATDVLPASAGFSTSLGFDLLQRGAKLLAASTLVPENYRGNLPNCVIALNMASRLGADPLLVMQNLYVVQGRPSWSAKFLIATFNQCGRFSAIRYEWRGEQGTKTWACRAWSTEKALGEKIYGAWITWDMVDKEGWSKKSGSKWLSIPEQMFMYRAAAWLVNTHAPELSMGLGTVEEMTDVFSGNADAGGHRVTTEELRNAEDAIEVQAREIAGEAAQAAEQPAKTA